MRRYRRPPRLAPLASEGGGTEKRTLHVLQKPDISFATDTPALAGCERSLSPLPLPSTRQFMNKVGITGLPATCRIAR